MPLLPRLQSWLRNMFRRDRVERDLDGEVRSYLELLTEEKIHAGMNPDEARRAARIELGGVEQVKEEVRDKRIGAMLDGVATDLHYALRMLGKSPGVTAVAILTLAIGIGANTAIFSVVHAVLLRPLPYPNPDRLAIVWSVFGNEGRAPGSGPELTNLRERSRLFEEFGGVWVQSGAITGEGDPEQVKVGWVTSNFLSFLAAHPQLGRFFLPGEQGPAVAPVAILSDGLWRRRFGADPQIVGRSMRLNGRGFTIVGVMSPHFRIFFPEGSAVPPDLDVYTPFRTNLAEEPRDQAYIRIIGRLRKAVTFQQAQAEVENIAAQLRTEFTEFSALGLGLQVVPLHGDLVRNVRPALLALLGGVTLVLLIACANVANLLLSRASQRQKEFTLRAALGASRGRIVRQLLTESILLSCCGGAAALVVGWWALKLLLALRPGAVLNMGSIGLDFAAFGFTSAVSVVAGILFGLAPAMGTLQVNLVDALKEGGRTSSAGKQRSRNFLIVCEAALAIVLLIGAGLMARTFAGLLRVDPGFNYDHVLTFQLSLPGVRYPTPEACVNFYRQLQENVSALPGVESVGLVSHLPFDDGLPNWYSYYWPDGAPKEEQNTTMADYRSTLPGYLPSLGVAFLAGRNFDETDVAQNRHVAIVDDTVAQRAWPNSIAVGKKLIIENGNFEHDWAEVVGVVKHVQYHSLANQVRGQVYLPYPLAVRPAMAFTVRARIAPETLVGAIRQQVANLDKDLPVSKFSPLEAYVAKARMETRFTTMLSGIMAGVALLLACIGIYGVSSFGVLQRKNEIGIRMALGAQRPEVLRMVIRQAMAPVVLGALLGLALSCTLTPLLRRLLFGVGPLDPATFGASCLFLFLAGLLACYIPARRATSVDPMVALRYE